MDIKECVKELTVGALQIALVLREQKPIAISNDVAFTHLWAVIEAFPNLSDLAYIEQFAIISNFFWKAGQFQYIESIAEYQNFYLEQIRLERSNPADLYAYRLTDFKLFDVSVMHLPQVVEGQLIYFTFNPANGLPYRVVCPFPYPLESTYVHYQILPILS